MDCFSWFIVKSTSYFDIIILQLQYERILRIGFLMPYKIILHSPTCIYNWGDVENLFQH